MKTEIEQFKNERDKVVENLIKGEWGTRGQLVNAVGIINAIAVRSVIVEAFNRGAVEEAGNRYK